MRSVVRGAAAAAVLALAVGAWTYDARAAAPAAGSGQVDIGGTPVPGASTDPGDPTSLDAGLWRLDLGAEGQPLRLTYDRRIQGSTVHIGAIGAPAGSAGDGLQLAATDAANPDDPEGDDCGSDSATTDSSASTAVVGVQVVVGEEVDQPDSTCTSAGTIAITLGRYSSSNDEDLPVALKIVEEAPTSDQGEPPPDDDALDFEVPRPADSSVTTAGAASFADAPLVDPRDGAVTIDTTVTEGTELLWRVPVSWSDQLVARVDLPALDSDEATELGSPSSYTRLAIVQPTRDLYAQTGDDGSYGYYGSTERSRLVVAGYPLRYLNRYSSDEAPVLPGDEWVSIAVAAAPADRSAVDVPVELTIAVTPTDAEPPTYQAAVLAQGGGAGPAGYSADKPYLVGDGEFSAVASGNPLPPVADDEPGWWTGRHLSGLGLGVISLGCCAAGAGWLTRRRRA
ncbi:hypothetical protein [Nocardioides sp. MH1]|uniref:hypothetical protein n=1 Tax=Nocardioides sp. MH1 TaxID=3242490 RepID=UPI0035219295